MTDGTPAIHSSNSEDEDEVTPEYLESLLEKARKNVAAAVRTTNIAEGEMDVIELLGDSNSM
jgi:hypothetical protein